MVAATAVMEGMEVIARPLTRLTRRPIPHPETAGAVRVAVAGLAAAQSRAGRELVRLCGTT